VAANNRNNLPLRNGLRQATDGARFATVASRRARCGHARPRRGHGPRLTIQQSFRTKGGPSMPPSRSRTSDGRRRCRFTIITAPSGSGTPLADCGRWRSDGGFRNKACRLANTGFATERRSATKLAFLLPRISLGMAKRSCGDERDPHASSRTCCPKRPNLSAR
jgi:hypothetical protein